MDGAEANDLNLTMHRPKCEGGARDEGLAVRPAEAGSSADLGGSSKYSNENFED